MYVIIAILVAAGILSWSSADNPCVGDRLGNYWFGPSCRFQCHCYDRRQCDSTTGSCSSLGCETGYFGPGCQYFSIAYEQPTTQSSTSSRSSSAVDGFTSTYSYTRSTLDPTWSVELQHPAWIVWVDVNVPANYGSGQDWKLLVRIACRFQCHLLRPEGNASPQQEKLLFYGM
ncbi:uncharacterized protein LOC124290768 [Haliotis rubra]|uniref:uncharacterized protein LOC124290768 n=1 Tax=Haliotis rubra TaxID=36100 RepID=UPI001EE62B8C|nr:uncharacterized protein LOC124290768 [Haliotis rubra]